MEARKNIGRRAAAFVVSAVAALGVAGVLGAIPASATTTAAITATTSVTNHPDTTNVSGGACKNGLTPNGPVWALDNYGSQMTATQSGADTWQVAIHDSGTYVAFADPTTCAPLLSTGSLAGDYAVTVTSTTPPTAAGLHATYDGEVTTTQMVEDFFGDTITASDVVGGAYTFSYQGGNYVQNTTGETGDVTSVACTLSVNKPANQTSVLNTAISPLQVTVTSNYPTSDLQFSATNLPKGLGLDSAAGKVTGTPTGAGTEVVTVEAINAGFSTDAAQCDGTATFSWTVSLTASSTSSNAFPKGGVQTGGGKPVGSPWLQLGIVLAGLATLLVGTAGAVAVRRTRTQQSR